MKKYIVYGRSTCPFCVKVVNKLIRQGKCFYVEMLDNDPDRLELIKKMYNHPTIPIVLCKDDTEILIGGCDETVEHLKHEVNDDSGETQTKTVS